MSGYRFCRTDDIPLLVDAYNACSGAGSTEPALTVAAFKQAARDIGLWASSCMLAFEGETPIAVLLGAKNAQANFVHRIVVREDRRLKGHGRHLLDSLRRKCAILGPPRLLTEVAAEKNGIRRFFERCEFAEQSRYADLVADAPVWGQVFPQHPPPGVAERPDPALVSAVTVEELVEAGGLAPSVPRCWQRSLEVIRKRSRELEGLAIASDVRIEAFVLHRDRDILALGASRPELLRPLIAAVYERAGAPLRMARAAEAEAPFATMGALGFRRETEYIGYAADIGEP